MSYQDLLAEANAAAEECAIDMSVAGEGGSFELVPEGPCLARLIGYVELGSHAGSFQGKPKPPKPTFYLYFALFGAQHQDPETGAPRIMRSRELTLDNNEKANAFKTFAKMNYGKTAKSFAQLLNTPYLLTVTHTTKKDTAGKEKMYANIDLLALAPPINVMAGNAFYDVPAVSDELFQLFLWDRPNPEQWAKLYIEGQRDDGTSKNWLQDHIRKAVNFPGSAVERMLIQGGQASIPVPGVIAPPVTVPPGAVLATQAVAAPVVAPVVVPPVIAAPTPVIAPAIVAPIAPVVPPAPDVPQ